MRKMVPLFSNVTYISYICIFGSGYVLIKLIQLNWTHHGFSSLSKGSVKKSKYLKTIITPIMYNDFYCSNLLLNLQLYF